MLKSKPLRTYSACLPQPSMLVNKVIFFTMFLSSLRLINSINLSQFFCGVFKFVLRLNSKLGMGFCSISFNNLNVSFAIKGSPPVSLKFFISFLSSGHHFQNASTYGLYSLFVYGSSPLFLRSCKL